jgi:Bacterial Ig-like domain (group 2)
MQEHVMASMAINMRRSMIVVTLAALALAACDSKQTANSSPNQPSPMTPVVGLARLELIVPPTIAPGESAQLTANAVQSDNSVQDVSAQARWMSTNPRVVEVGDTGVAKAVAAGEALITASYQARGASTRTFVLPVGTYRIGGTVTEAGDRLAGATVTVISGVGEGLTSTTNGGGDYAVFGVSGRVGIQVKKDGYVNRVDQIEVTDHRVVSFELVPDHPRPDLSGIYALTISAASCAAAVSLPDDLTTRSYTAKVAQDGPRLDVTLTGADLIVTRGRGDHFTGSLGANEDVRFTIGQSLYYYDPFGYDLVERLTGTTALIVNGGVTAKATPTRISGTLSGLFLLAQGAAPPFSQIERRCSANAHRFDMVRR